MSFSDDGCRCLLAVEGDGKEEEERDMAGMKVFAGRREKEDDERERGRVWNRGKVGERRGGISPWSLEFGLLCCFFGKLGISFFFFFNRKVRNFFLVLETTRLTAIF